MEVHKIIAVNLKKLRTERNLSLSQLALLCGMSKVMLSQIEKGETNPTINTIWKIAKGLKIPYTTLLEQQEHDITILTPDDIVSQSDDEHYRIYCYYETSEKRSFEMFQIELDANHSHTSIGHLAKSKEYIMVLSGQLTLKIDEQEHILEKDHAITFDSSKQHTYISSGKETLKAIIINDY